MCESGRTHADGVVVHVDSVPPDFLGLFCARVSSQRMFAPRDCARAEAEAPRR